MTPVNVVALGTSHADEDWAGGCWEDVPLDLLAHTLMEYARRTLIRARLQVCDRCGTEGSTYQHDDEWLCDGCNDVADDCPTCGGSSGGPDDALRCCDCGGSGHVRVRHLDED